MTAEPTRRRMQGDETARDEQSIWSALHEMALDLLVGSLSLALASSAVLRAAVMLPAPGTRPLRLAMGMVLIGLIALLAWAAYRPLRRLAEGALRRRRSGRS